MDSSCISKAKTKDEFLNKAHEARLARELARRQDTSATVLQSYARRFITLRRLRNDLFQEKQNLGSFHLAEDSKSLSKSIRRILFFSRATREIDILDSLIHYIHRTKPNRDFSLLPQNEASIETDNNDNISEIQMCHNNPLSLLIIEASKNEYTFQICKQTLSRLVDACCQLIERDTSKSDTSMKQNELSAMIVYINVINRLTIGKPEDLPTLMDNVGISDSVKVESYKATFNEILASLSETTLSTRLKAFMAISETIAKSIKGPRTDEKSSFLNAFINMALNILVQYNGRSLQVRDKTTPIDRTQFLIKLLSIPALIYHLERLSCESLEWFKKSDILTTSIGALSSHHQHTQDLTSTPALCIVANLIHTSAISECLTSIDLIPLVVTTTKLLDCCQKNVKELNACKSLADQNKREARKFNAATDESYNHVLGWLMRETSHRIDQETSDLIKTQLSHLWSEKFLRLLLNDLIKANDNYKSNRLTQPSIKNKTRSESSRRTSRDESNQTKCDTINSSAPMTSFKRVVERAAHSMTKSIGNQYNKTISSSGSSCGSSKLMTEEARRISLVCLMLHTSLKTLKMIKQDILTGLCFHDYVLRNLWEYICSLGPGNGLKAFLDHLVINSKSNAPEFYILMLFCECASHIISILDDSELYERQTPFTLEDLINISTFLNTFVFRVINNQLVTFKAQDMDPILSCTHNLLTDLYKRDCRRTYAPAGHWLAKELKMSIFLRDLDSGKPVAQAILNLLPHIIPHKERVLIFRKFVARDRSACYSTFITIHRSRIVEDGYQQLARLPTSALKGLIRVKFINDHGLDEAGIDQDGVFKEFLEDAIKRVFDPSLNLFSTTCEQRLYPSPTSRLHEDHLSLFNFVGKLLGKAVYEGIVVDVPFATFFLARVLGQHHSKLYSPIDDLASLDPELYKNLIYIRHHDVSNLDLTFSIDQDIMGKIENFELEPGGRHIPVTNQNRVRYIHSVANFRMRTQIEEQTKAFVSGFKSIVNLEWLHMFSASEFQRLISGDTAPIDLQDLRRNTKYFGGFHNNHRVISWLWDVLESDFTPEEHSLFLKFVTSCSKPPLLGFENLEPPFSIRCVEVSDDQDSGDTVGSVLRGFFAIRRSDPVDRLPTSSTCFNLLKLPNYQRRATLREKLRYAIRSSPGFELS